MAEETKSFGDLKSTLIKAKTSAPEDAAKVDNKRDSKGRAYATGRRKDAVARVWIKPGRGQITINGRDEKVYFARVGELRAQPAAGAEAGWFPHPRSARCGTQEIRPSQGSPFVPVQQALIRFRPRARSGQYCRDEKRGERRCVRC